MNFLAKTYQLLALTINFIAEGLLLISAYSYLIPPDRFSLPYFFTLAFPVFFFIEILLLLQIFIRPRKYVLLPIAFLLLSFQAVQNYFPIHFEGKDNKTGKISLLSYNIRSFVQSKPTDNGKSNTVLDLLRNSGADIICLQEYNTVPSGSNHQLSQKMVEKVLSDYPYHHVFKPTPWNSGIACFSKYPFKNIEPIPFDRSQNGACLYQFDIDGKSFSLINCHLESNHLEPKDRELYEQIAKNPTQSTDLLPQAKSRLLGKLKRAGTERAKQARLIRQIADGITGAVVICGDFNDTPQSYAYRKIRDDFSDAYVSTGFGPGITYNEQGFWFRIDHILYNNVLRAVDSRIVRQKHSDHYPLRATLQWNTKND